MDKWVAHFISDARYIETSLCKQLTQLLPLVVQDASNNFVFLVIFVYIITEGAWKSRRGDIHEIMNVDAKVLIADIIDGVDRRDSAFATVVRDRELLRILGSTLGYEWDLKLV